MKTGTSTLMDNVLNKDNELNKSGNYAEEWDIDSIQEHRITGPAESNICFIPQPEYVGGYRIGKRDTGYIQFNLDYKPNWFHRQIMKLCLGWYWYDAK
jgi:hypothetical protein